MPVYQYACTECEEQLEVRQTFTDDALTVCPVCEGRLRKVLNAVGVVFKGSGFYRNDSRAAANGSSATTAGAPDKAGADNGSSSTSDGASTKESGSKETGSKDSGSKDSGSTGSGSKDAGSKDAGSNGSGSKDAGSNGSGSGSRSRSKQSSGSKRSPSGFQSAAAH